MAPIPSTLMSSGSKKKEPRYVYLSKAKASHSHRTWTEVSSSVPHFLQGGLLLSPIICRCLLKVLCPVSRQNSTYPNTGYPDRLDPSCKCVDNYTQLICLEITHDRTKYSTVLWLLELRMVDKVLDTGTYCK